MNLKDFANGTAAFFKLLRNGKLHELDKLMEAGKLIGEFRVTKFENDNAFASGDAYSIGDPFRNQLVNTGLIAIWDLVTESGRYGILQCECVFGCWRLLGCCGSHPDRPAGLYQQDLYCDEWQLPERAV